jgi:NAD(P)-dependent dehydrogenase (short-subunit alcohol dehydrogenase family)
MANSSQRLLLFGASGAIGSAILERAAAKGWHVTAVSRTRPADIGAAVAWVAADPLDASFSGNLLDGVGPCNSVCWAQGANSSDSVYDVDPDANLALYKVNCLYILITLRALLDRRLLEPGSRLVVLSSIWQSLARQSKLSYCMTKAALEGLVLSASVDLAADGHLINAVLPGALDTPMTRRNLSAEQIGRLTAATKFERLPQLEDVTSLVCYLCSRENTGITGQFIASDLGYSRVRIV